MSLLLCHISFIRSHAANRQKTKFILCDFQYCILFKYCQSINDKKIVLACTFTHNIITLEKKLVSTKIALTIYKDNLVVI